MIFLTIPKYPPFVHWPYQSFAAVLKGFAGSDSCFFFCFVSITPNLGCDLLCKKKAIKLSILSSDSKLPISRSPHKKLTWDFFAHLCGCRLCIVFTVNIQQVFNHTHQSCAQAYNLQSQFIFRWPHTYVIGLTKNKCLTLLCLYLVQGCVASVSQRINQKLFDFLKEMYSESIVYLCYAVCRLLVDVIVLLL